MNLRPLSDRVLVERLKPEEKSPGGIIIPDNAKEKPIEGKVLAVGNGINARKALRNQTLIRYCSACGKELETHWTWSFRSVERPAPQWALDFYAARERSL